MKKVVIAGFLGIISSMWALALVFYVTMNLVNAWSGSRFWYSASELGVQPVLVLASVGVVCSLAILGIEYFRKDGKNESEP